MSTVENPTIMDPKQDTSSSKATEPTATPKKRGVPEGLWLKCPGCGASVLESFGRATRSERGSPGPVDCEACGFRGSVEDLLYRPPAAWGAWAFVVADVGSAHLTPFGEELFREHLVGARQVWRRVS